MELNFLNSNSKTLNRKTKLGINFTYLNNTYMLFPKTSVHCFRKVYSIFYKIIYLLNEKFSKLKNELKDDFLLISRLLSVYS